MSSFWNITKSKPEFYESKLMKKEQFLCVFQKFDVHQATQKFGESLDSPKIISSEKLKYTVRIYPNGCLVFVNCIVIQLACLNKEYSSRMPKALYSISILNEKNTKSGIEAHDLNIPTANNPITMKISHAAVQKLLVNGNLRILVEITTAVGDKPLPPPVSPVSNDDLLKFFVNEKFTDVILEFNGTELKTHKILLSLKSPVFCTMFENETMKEAQESRVIIEDIDAEVGRQMLEFIYTDQEPSRLNELTAEILIAADKYEIDELKKMCQIKMMTEISVDNAVSILSFSNMYNAEFLKKCVIDFIGAHAELLKSDRFSILERRDTQLAMEVYRHLLTKKMSI